MSIDPVRYSTGVEEPTTDEDETIDGLIAAFDTILDRTAADYGHAVRSVHAKAHAVLEGALIVDDGLPPELAQGLFAAPGRHKAYVRMSTNAGDILPDAISLPRGMAIKVLDVAGDRLTDAEGTTQDFVLVNSAVFQAKTAAAFLGNLKLLAKTTDRLEGAKAMLSATLRGVNIALEAVGIDSATVKSLGGVPNAEPLGLTYYSAVPFRYGDYLAKFSVVPVATEMQALTDETIDIDGREDAIREDLRAELQRFETRWEFRVQLCRDLDRQPIEDPTIEWDEAEAPFRRVAILVAPAQDSWSSDRVRQIDEGMRFSVWTGLEAHRPLGNINRARRRTYRHSADFRATFNRCPIHEPSEQPGE